MHLARSLVTGITLLAATAGLTPTVTPPAAHAADYRPRVIAMGDSYASGEGLFSYDAHTNVPGNRCHRSLGSWQRRLVQDPRMGPINERNRRYVYQQVACSGARTTNIDRAVRPVTDQGRAPVQRGEKTYQMDYLTGHEDIVLLSIGGNDLGFKNILVTCSARLPSACRSVIAKYRPAVPAVAANMERIVRDIHRRSPRAKIVVAGYPFVVDAPSNPAGLCLGVESVEAKAIRDMTNTVNNEYARRIGSLRKGGLPVRYANMAYAWTHTDGRRHDACVAATPWINAVRPGRLAAAPESYHPNAAGHAAYARVASAALRS